MVDPVTPNRGLAVPVRGSDVGTWDIPVNGDMTILDNILGSVAAISLTNANVTLTTEQAQCAVLRLSGTLTGNVAITLPQQAFYIVQNQCSGAFVVTLKASSAGNIIGIPRGNSFQVFNDGTDVAFTDLGQTGKMEWWYASAMPAWVAACTVNPYLALDGSTFNATTYAALNAFLGTNTLPDFRSYAPIPLDDMGTAAGPAGRIGTVNTGNGTIVGSTIGTAGGKTTNTIGLVNLPATNLSLSGLSIPLTNGNTIVQGGGPFGQVANGSDRRGFNNPPETVTITAGITGTLPLGGSGTALNNFQPSKMSGIFVIKT